MAPMTTCAATDMPMAATGSRAARAQPPGPMRPSEEADGESIVPPGCRGGDQRSLAGSVTMPSFSTPARRTRSMVSTTWPYWSPWSALR